MKKVIYKYPIPTDSRFSLPIPFDAILSIQLQNGFPMLWALTDPNVVISSNRQFIVVETGHLSPSSEGLKYIGTFQVVPFVWHLFEILK